MSEGAIDIVVVDDNEVLLSVLSEIFKDCGYTVRTALNGLRALTEIRSCPPDILLSDLNMPCMSGFELLSIVRRRYPLIKVIAMSSSYSTQTVPREVAADAFYEKGAASVAQLLQIVTSTKNNSELRSKRVPTPIWVPRSLLDSQAGTHTFVACPECLRAYPYRISGEGHVHHRDCPYCQHPIQVALVPADAGVRRRCHSRVIS